MAMEWKLHHRKETASTNLDARSGGHGDVFTADFQSAGRGRLDHKWISPPATNLMMSAVLSVYGMSPESLSTFPLVVGLAVAKALSSLLGAHSKTIGLKWPNDIWISGRKVAGILCELDGNNVIAGIGVNVGRQEFPPEIAGKAVSLADVSEVGFCVSRVRDAVLAALDDAYGRWKSGGFAAIYGEVAAIDVLKGRRLSVRQTDVDDVPVRGVSNGINPDGSLDVEGVCVYAGEANVERID